MVILPIAFFTTPLKGEIIALRESNVHRLAEVSTNIIDQCVAQGVPFCTRLWRLVRQSLFWRGIGFQNLLCQRADRTTVILGAYSAMNRQIGRGKIKMYNRHEMMDLVLVDGKARGIIHPKFGQWKIESAQCSCSSHCFGRVR